MDKLHTENEAESYYLLDDSDDDDWYYASISRFEQLQMFNFETPANHLDFSENDRICCTSKIRDRKQELQEFILPEKITSSAFESHDLKLKTGGFSYNPVYQMKCFKGRRRLVLSEEATVGASIYQLGYENSDLIEKIDTVKCSVENSQLSVYENKLALGSSTHNIHLADLETCLASKCSVTDNSEGEIFGLNFIDINTLAYCKHHSGQVTLLDLRSENKNTYASSKDTCSVTDGSLIKIWSSFAVHKQLNFFGLTSLEGDIKIYDFRCVRNSPLFETKLNVEEPHFKGNFMQIVFSPHDMFSVSSSRGTVEVFSLKADKMKCIFSYDGHNHQKFKNDILISNHIWSHLEKNLIYSSAIDGSFHCWKFIEI